MRDSTLMRDSDSLQSIELKFMPPYWGSASFIYLQDLVTATAIAISVGYMEKELISRDPRQKLLGQCLQAASDSSPQIISRRSWSYRRRSSDQTLHVRAQNLCPPSGNLPLRLQQMQNLSALMLDCARSALLHSS